MEGILRVAREENFQEHLDSELKTGIEDWNDHSNVLLEKLAVNAQGGQNIEEFRQKLERMGMSQAGQHTLIESRVDVNSFESIYVCLIMNRSNDGKFNCCNAMYSLDFEFDELPGLTLEEATECKDEFMKNQTLKKLKDQGLINSINYVQE